MTEFSWRQSVGCAVLKYCWIFDTDRGLTFFRSLELCTCPSDFSTVWLISFTTVSSERVDKIFPKLNNCCGIVQRTLVTWFLFLQKMAWLRWRCCSLPKCFWFHRFQEVRKKSISNSMSLFLVRIKHWIHPDILILSSIFLIHLSKLNTLHWTANPWPELVLPGVWLLSYTSVYDEPVTHSSVGKLRSFTFQMKTLEVILDSTNNPNQNCCSGPALMFIFGLLRLRRNLLPTVNC